MRVGVGYDVHRLVRGRPLVIGGVVIPSELGLEGHSDADVLLHAVMDALLGAAGLEDIGHHFPPGDERFRGASSLALLADVIGMVTAGGWLVTNVDSSVIAEQPRLSPFIPQMKQAIREVLGIDAGRIGIKATTNEGLGFAGRREGIAAMAVALLQRNDEQHLEG